MKYHNFENLVFRNLFLKEINDPYKNNRLKEINRMGNCIKLDTLTSVDIVETVKRGGINLEVSEGFFCHNLLYKTYADFVTDMFETRDLIEAQGKNSLQNPEKKIRFSVYGGSNGKDLSEEYIVLRRLG